MATLKDQYDWVVIGDHPAALFTAAMASRLGLSVMVLNPFPGVMRGPVSSEIEFDPEPNILLGVRGAEGEDLFLPLMEEGVGGPRSELKIDPAPTGLLFPFARLELAGGFENHQKELEREFGRNRSELESFLKVAKDRKRALLSTWFSRPGSMSVKLGAWAEKSWETWVRENRIQKKKETNEKVRDWFLQEKPNASLFPPDWDCFIKALHFSVFQTLESEPDPEAVLDALFLAGSAGQVRGGIRALRRYLRKSAEGWGAYFAEGYECRRMFVSDDRLVAVQVSATGNLKTKTVGVGGGVLGMSLDHVRGFLEGLRAGERKYSLKATPKPQGWWFSIALEVPKDAIPTGVSPRMIWSEADGEPVIFEIETLSSIRSSMEDRVFIYVRTLLPFEKDSLTDAVQKQVAGRMIHLARQLFPFVEKKMIRVWPNYLSNDEKVKSVFGFAAPELIPENLRCYQSGGVGCESGIGKLYVATSEAYPELGALGPWVGACESLGRYLSAPNIYQAT